MESPNTYLYIFLKLYRESHSKKQHRARVRSSRVEQILQISQDGKTEISAHLESFG